jgi:hypothetical protein
MAKYFVIGMVAIMAAAGIFVAFSMGIAPLLPGSSQQFTMDMYQRIYPGQELEDVVSLMKNPGTPTATTAAPGFVCQGYMWQNPNGSNIQVLFMNGKVHTKAQAGLR